MRLNAIIDERSKMASLVFVVFLAGYVQSEYNFQFQIKYRYDVKCHSSLSQAVSLSLPVDVIVSDVGGESATVLWNSTVNTSLIEHFMVSDK